jgi:hypothetical protein
VGSLDRWRERCELHVAQNKDAPHYEHRRIGIRLGVERALSYGCDTPGTMAFCIDREDYRQSTETVCVGSPASFICDGLRLALTWLREEMAKDPDHA